MKDKRNLSLVMDFYELTMSQCYFNDNKDKEVVFDLFYRKNPDDGGYCVFAGLEQVVDYVSNLHFEKEDIDYLIPHQANIRIIESAAKRLHLPMDKVFVNIEKYGNASAASIPIAMAEAYQSGKLKKGEIIALSGFGAGLTWASCIMKWAKED